MVGFVINATMKSQIPFSNQNVAKRRISILTLPRYTENSFSAYFTELFEQLCDKQTKNLYIHSN
jgi:hypothetical protein